MSGSKSSAPAAPSPEPGESLSLTVHELPAPALADAGQRRGRLLMLIVMALCAAPVIASYLTYYVIRPQGRSNYGALIDPPRELPAASALPLRDEAGRSVVPRSLHGQWLMVVVGGSACDTHCEHLLYAQRQLREMTGKEKDRIDRVWLVTDEQPVRAALRPALEGATVLHAPPQAVAAWLAPEAGHALGDHLYLVDPMGRWMMRFPAQLDPPRARRDLDRLLRAAAWWDLPGREPQGAGPAASAAGAAPAATASAPAAAASTAGSTVPPAPSPAIGASAAR